MASCSAASAADPSLVVPKRPRWPLLGYGKPPLEFKGASADLPVASEEECEASWGIWDEEVWS